MTRVIKVGGRPQADPALAGFVATSCDAAPGSTMIVHGGGDEISALQRAFGITPSFIDGRRVTSDVDIDIVRMALSGVSNKRLVAALADCGVNAIGISGEDGSLIEARPIDTDKLGHVGTPSRINTHFLKALLAAGFVPVISPVSRGVGGTTSAALNVNGDDAAAAIAVDVGADELLLIVDVPGVMRGDVVVNEMDADDAQRMLDDGTASGGMRAKLQAAVLAAHGGVRDVRITDMRGIADSTCGTFIRGVSS
jgi:acetylglutamate kinase